MDSQEAPRGLVAVQGLIVAEGLLRILRSTGELYGYDYEATIIYWSVVIASIGRFMRADDLNLLIEQDGPIPQEAHHPISARAIAEATGLPRETVRRKIAALVAEGHLFQDRRGVRTHPPLLEQRGNRAFALMASREFKRTVAALEAAEAVAAKAGSPTSAAGTSSRPKLGRT